MNIYIFIKMNSENYAKIYYIYCFNSLNLNDSVIIIIIIKSFVEYIVRPFKVIHVPTA